ncbi:MAG: carnitine 3-dehydrogenase [Rhodobacteraceae bacterium]|nr:carnitine 3-dehydrogenase [Paracoccaceae bacterium]
MTRVAAIIGGGVIGGGWAARFLLMGWDVRVFDTDPEAERKVSEVLDRARRALPSLYEVALPPEGTLSFCATMSEAVAGAEWIQESLPERLDLKRKVFQTIQEHCDAGAVIGSSTSGFMPSELQGCATRPEQIIVAHPFVPVYLIPLVELVGSEKTPPELMERAKATLSELGMFPLQVRREVPAHIADRLLEAVWRESLWLVKDGVATTEEIDEAIRMGFGLRWGQMGLFETYRLGGGDAGMAQFLQQFGPALQWPWTKLTDVPDLDDELIGKIAAQSDAQSGAHSASELAAMRDANLVAMMRGLKIENRAVGAHLNAMDRRLRDESVDIEKPIVTVARTVPLDWGDYNGHMTEARYLHAFGNATDRFMEIIGVTDEYIATGGSFFTAETHIRHLSEAALGAPIRIETRCLLGEGKKMHLWHEMYEGDRLLATGEHMLIHVSLETRRPAPPAPQIADKLGAIAEAHAKLPSPEGIGRAVGRK